MLPPIQVFRQMIRMSIASARAEGHDVDSLSDELTATGDSYDAMLQLAHRVAAALMRADWPYVEPDDLESNWLNFTKDQLLKLWLKHQSVAFTWGPERAIMARGGMKHWGDNYGGCDIPVDYHEWTHVCNPNGELCGAVIRADAYGYASP